MITTAVRGTRSAIQFLRVTVSFGAVAIALAACSGARPAVAVAPTSSCLLGAAPSPASDTLSIATAAPVDWAHAPEPTNAAERLAFAQVYETLIDVDCDGHARPALAASWGLDDTHTRIIFTLRNGAQFGSGKPVTASDVLAAWRTTAGRSTSASDLAHDIAARTSVIDDHTLIVSLPDTAWLVLADPMLAVYLPQSGTGLAEGSGAYRVADSPAGGFALKPSPSASGPYLVSRRIPTGDPRDAIDAGTDVLITNDPLAANYAAVRANMIAFPLPWSRTYALAIPRGVPRIVQLLSTSDSIRQSLARDAVHGEARAAEPPYWWDVAPSCHATLDALRATGTLNRSNRIVYRRDDRIARGLAERLVALDPHTVAAGLSPNDFTRALSEDGDFGYVLDLPRRSLSSCGDLSALRAGAPWLASLGTDAKLVPLVDTRETAIVNRQRVSATVDWRGTLRFGGARRQP